MQVVYKTILRFLFIIVHSFEKIKIFINDKYYKSILDIHKSAVIGNCYMDDKNISIGEGTYIKSGEIFTGKSFVSIGKYCAIGKNVSIKARTHDLCRPTANSAGERHTVKYSPIKIGNYIWIGDNVFIREGVSVGDHAVIAANSVVTDDIPPRAIVGGIPAKIIRYNTLLEDSFYECKNIC